MLLVQGGMGYVQLAGSGNLVGELELLVQGGVGDGQLSEGGEPGFWSGVEWLM